MLANRACMTVSGTPGTGTITLGSAVSGCQSFSAAGMIDGGVYSYAVNDGSPLGTAWEYGQGTYSASAGTFARTTVVATSAGTTSPITLTAASQIEITPLASDMTSSPVRQTVSIAPVDANGAPTFLPAGGVSRDVILHFDGTNGGTTTSDSGGGANAPHTVTLNGNAALSTAQAKFGTGSLYTSQSSASTNTNGATIAAAADLGFGTGDFTVECEVYQTAYPSYYGLIFGNGTGGSTSFYVAQSSSGTIQFYCTTGSNTSIVGSTVMPLNAWNHVAVCRASGVTRLWVNGVLQGSTFADTNNYAANAFVIGKSNGTFVNDLQGYFDEFATLKGTALYTSAFTPPSAAFSASPASSSLTLTTQNLSASSPLVVTGAAGGSGAGAINLVQAFLANVSWPAATASAGLVYLALDAGTGARSLLALQPIYQLGGTPSTVAGQYTFIISQWQGYLGSGTTAVPSNLVIVGEANVGASTITTATAYALNGYYDSGWTAGLPSGLVLTSKNTNLGVLSQAAPKLILECTTADSAVGAAVGDEMTFSHSWAYTNGFGFAIYNTRNATAFIFGSNGITVQAKNGSGVGTLTPSCWKWKLVVARGWPVG